MPRKLERIPEFGVEIIEGLPGSGKSLLAVRRVAEVVLADRRPCYTNLPLRFPVFRRYLQLQGLERAAELVQELKQEHFSRFIERFAAMAAVRDAHRRLRGPRVDERVVESEFFASNGPHITTGPDANWIPATSLVVLDEVHWWYPMSKQGAESPALLKYLSMHRHVWHWVWAITQEAGRISIAFRKMCTKYTRVRNIREDCVCWDIKLKHFGLSGMGYAVFSGDQVEGRSADNVKPLENYVWLPWLPWNRHWFRLYDSFSHLGKKSDLERVLREERRAAGVDLETAAPQGANDEGGNMPTAEAAPKRAGGGIKRAAALVCAAGLIGFALGRSTGTTAPPVLVGDVTADGKAQAVTWPAWRGVAADAVVFADGRVKVGGRLGNGAQLVSLAPDGRRLLLVRAGDVWLWQHGEPGPRRLGSVPIVEAAIRGAVGRSAGQSGAPANGLGAVEPPPRDPSPG